MTGATCLPSGIAPSDRTAGRAYLKGSAALPLAENKMRMFLRGCLVWLVAYPLSVIVATVVLTAPVWITADRPLDAAVALLRSAGPVVALFSFPAAVLTAPSSSVWHYVAAGIRTGAWCAALVISLYAIVLVVGVSNQFYRWMTSGVMAPDLLLWFATASFWIAAATAVFAVAGAVGGFVFGLVASTPRR